MDNNNSLVKSVGNLPSFLSDGFNPQKNPKLVPSVIGLGAVGVGSWAVIKFAVPAIMAIVSPVLAGAATFFIALGAVALVKPTWKWMKAIAHKISRAAIAFNPEIVIENRLTKFGEMVQIYRDALAKMESARSNFLKFANTAETKAKSLQQNLKDLEKKISELRQAKQEAQANVAKLNANKPKTQKEREEYHDALDRLASIDVKLNQLSSRVTSYTNLLNMNLSWTESYAAKANIFANWVTFLKIGSGLIENKKIELDNWWKEVKEQMKAAEAGKDATEALRQALCLDQDYDVDYAISSILDVIDHNYSVTSQNMEELMRRVDGFDFNSDDAYNQLEDLLKGLESGEIEMPFAREIASPAHKLTAKEKDSAGVLGQSGVLGQVF